MQTKALYLALAGLLLSSPVFAQEGTRTPVAHKQTLSTAPISDILGFFNIEYQRKVSEGLTLGASAGIFDEDFDPGGDDHMSNVMGFARYYPQGAALTGFFLGARAGVFRDTVYVFDDVRFETHRETRTRGAIGLDVGYDWLIGRKQNVLIGLGAGAVRLLGDSEYYGLDAYPTARVNVGFAF